MYYFKPGADPLPATDRVGDPPAHDQFEQDKKRQPAQHDQEIERNSVKAQGVIIEQAIVNQANDNPIQLAPSIMRVRW